MILIVAASWGCGGGQNTGSNEVGAVLPFEPPPSASTAGITMQESVHKWREQPRHLPEDAPNVLIVILDDAVFGQIAEFANDWDGYTGVMHAYRSFKRVFCLFCLHPIVQPLIKSDM